jgi:hypothetical protein
MRVEKAVFFGTILLSLLILTACTGNITGKAVANSVLKQENNYCRLISEENLECSACSNAGECGSFCDDICILKKGSVERASGRTKEDSGAKRVVCGCECRVC